MVVDSNDGLCVLGTVPKSAVRRLLGVRKSGEGRVEGGMSSLHGGGKV